ncbi:hypothetical protein AWQ21_13160 [Picosynechococcus sp. PCC 7003]|uniref:hypothetical protein n=1 Tax=Picosynechococcus sp. PCC 7003 TaxID=374981 RepID=UPI000810BBE7|nr:hypothetical protein [Picosynechococcus sp. PCC 7003]ANV85240.1 hypothetical protein AWQ21_13160 [Picosynechococcus sp. PCC 7003]
MVHWQFLLQKKGDRNWDILQTETLNLAPGEYRLAARGDAQAEIHCEIRLPQGQREQRTDVTTDQGLFAIMPLRHLGSGEWVITCRSLDVTNPWEKRLTLQVTQPTFQPLPLPPNPNVFSFETTFSLADSHPNTAAHPAQRTSDNAPPPQLEETESTPVTDFVTDTDQSTAENETLEELAGVEASSTPLEAPEEFGLPEAPEPSEEERSAALLEDSLAALDELLKEELEPIWAEMDQEAQAQIAAAPPAPPTLDIPPTPLPYQIVLEQAVYPLDKTQALELRGDIQPNSAVGESQQISEPGTLTFTLRDPQTAAVVTTLTAAIALEDFPCAFSQTITLDGPLTTLLLVGEITLHTGAGILLAQQTFSLMADYGAIASQLSAKAAPKPDSPAPTTPPPKPLKLPTPEAVPPSPQPQSHQTPTILPPKLKTKGQKSSTGLQLPNFAPKATIPDAPDKTESTAEAPASPPDQPVEALEKPHLEDETPQTAAPETDPDTAAQDSQPPAAESSETLPAGDLDWNSRFFTRLNALAVDGEDSTWLMPKPEPEPEPPTASPEVTPEAENPIPTPSPRLEIVVDSLWDEELAALEPEQSPEIVSEFPESEMPAAQADVAPLPVPEPQLHLDKTTYQVADLAVVELSLPAGSDRLHGQLWLQDRQTRELLAGPFQLMTFTPGPEGRLYCRQVVSIPPGALALRFEAIALDPHSHQESRKVSQDCQVLLTAATDGDWPAFDSGESW